jgi:hypothetical protein
MIDFYTGKRYSLSCHIVYYNENNWKRLAEFEKGMGEDKCPRI